MKKHTSFISTVLLTGVFSMVLLFSCKKEEPPAPVVPQPVDYTVLPPITQVGANTFGCKINGEVWVPMIETPEYFGDPVNCVLASLYESDGRARGYLNCDIIKPDVFDFFIEYGPTFFRTGTYYSPDCYVIFHNEFYDTYILSSPDSSANWINISHIDSTKNIVAGTFNFLLVNPEAPYDSIRIEEGRFDMRYIPY